MTENIPKTMHAVVLTGHGGFDKLKFHRDWPVPVPESGEVLIRVAACGLNNTDVNTRSAWYSKGNSDATTGDALVGAEGEDGTWGGASVSFPRIQGADAVGTVVRVGDGVTHSLIGRRVIIDGWLRDWNDPLNREKAGYFGSECDGGGLSPDHGVMNSALGSRPAGRSQLLVYSVNSCSVLDSGWGLNRNDFHSMTIELPCCFSNSSRRTAPTQHHGQT